MTNGGGPHLLIFPIESLHNLPSIWNNSDSVAGNNNDHYIHTNAGQLNLPLAQGLLQEQSHDIRDTC